MRRDLVSLFAVATIVTLGGITGCKTEPTGHGSGACAAEYLTANPGKTCVDTVRVTGEIS